MKAFSHRFFFQFSVGFLFGAGFMLADLDGKALLIAGALFGVWVFSK